VKIGFFSPLPPAHTGVADYSAALLAELRKNGEVEVGAERCDLALYHLGNNSLHAEVYRRAMERPGIVVLHDALLNHFLLGQFSEAAYVEEVVYNYGEWNRSLAHDLWRDRAASASDRRYFEFPMLRRIAERSLAVVVHNPAAADRVRQHVPGARVVQIPHLFVQQPKPSAAETIRLRQRLGFEAGDFVFGVFGYLRESKRLDTVLRAFARLRGEGIKARLFVAGEFVSTDLERGLSPFLAGQGIARLPHLPEREFWLAASAVDACINLRYPAAGETSGIAIRLMGIGKPVMVTRGAEYASVPEGACILVESGAAELDSLHASMVLLTSINEAAESIGQWGSEHIRLHHRVEDVSRQYWDLMCEICA
jgi:glycosyltransferase involved in cell wall biosynthesis